MKLWYRGGSQWVPTPSLNTQLVIGTIPHWLPGLWNKCHHSRKMQMESIETDSFPTHTLLPSPVKMRNTSNIAFQMEWKRVRPKGDRDSYFHNLIYWSFPYEHFWVLSDNSIHCKLNNIAHCNCCAGVGGYHIPKWLHIIYPNLLT